MHRGISTRTKPRNCRARGITTLELLTALVIVGILASVAIPTYSAWRYKSEVAQAISDIKDISTIIDRFFVDNKRYPNSLAEISQDTRLDPWGRAYAYLEIFAAGNKAPGVRKDKKLKPINSDYDLYSVGKDGDSVATLTSKKSLDDVVRANSGQFVGLAKDY